MLGVVVPAGFASTCPAVGQWQESGGESLETAALFDRLAGAQVIVLGEQHGRATQHRWQLHTLAALHSRQPNMVIGLEMLPRAAQPVLDAWVEGRLKREEFIEESDWHRVWGHDPDLYMPILHFARMHRVPLIALNVERDLARRLAAEGWDAVPARERHHVSAPAEAPAAYREWLGEVFEAHPTGATEEPDLERFVRAQLVWDRVMAAALAEHARPDRLVVALAGSGHVRFGHGIPHQLADLGIRDTRVLLPWPAGPDCEPPDAGLADAVFGIEPAARRVQPSQPPQPSLPSPVHRP